MPLSHEGASPISEYEDLLDWLGEIEKLTPLPQAVADALNSPLTAEQRDRLREEAARAAAALEKLTRDLKAARRP